MKKSIVTTLLLLSITVIAFAGMQEDRKVFIDKLINMKIIQKVEIPGSLPHEWVAPKLYALNFDDKQQFISVIHAYYITKNKKYDLVVLYDSKSGKKIGVYGKNYGGLKMY